MPYFPPFTREQVTLFGTSLVGAADAAAARTLLGVSAAPSGTTAQYLRGDGSLATLNQAAVAGLTTASTPTFAGINVPFVSPTSHVFEQYSGTSAQRFSVFNTRTSSTSFERASLEFASDVARLVTQKGSTGGTARDLVLGTDNTERMRILTNGNVGIGTTAPTTKLNVVQGGTPSSGSTYGVKITGSTGQFPGFLLERSDVSTFTALGVGPNASVLKFSSNLSRFSISTDTFANKESAGTGTELFSILPNGNVGIGTTAPGSKLQVVGSDSLNTSFAGNISGATGTGLVITNAGNVGIGTTGPGYKLDVTGDIRTTTDMRLNGTDRNRYIYLDYNSANWPNYSGYIAQTGASDVAGTRGLIINENTGQAVSNYGIGFAIDGANKMFIQNSGNVGIGTTGPLSRLVLDATGTNKTGNANYGTWLYGADDSTTKFALAATGAAGSTSAGLFVRNDGNIGIGTTTPTVRLDVAGNIIARNSTAATRISAHNTWTSSTNYERASLLFTSNLARLTTQKGSTGGTARDLSIERDEIEHLRLIDGATQSRKKISVEPTPVEDNTEFTALETTNYSGKAINVKGTGVSRFAGPMDLLYLPSSDPGIHGRLWHNGLAVHVSMADPASLFAASQPGGFLDPYDLTTMWQTDDTSTPVTAVGQTIGRWAAKHGSEFVMIQPTSGSRPVLARHPASGLRNLFQQTEDASHGYWTKSTLTIASTTDKPPALLAAFRAQPTGAFGGSFSRSTIWPGMHVHNVSVFAKAAENTFLQFRPSDDGAILTQFNLSTGQIHTTGASRWSNHTFQNLGNGWWRISATYTPSATTVTHRFIDPTAVSGTNGILLGGMQITEGPEVLPYQRVTAAADITESGVPDLYYARFDGTDDGMYSNANVDFSGTDKHTLIHVTRLNKSESALILGLTTDANAVNGGWHHQISGSNWQVRSRGNLTSAIVVSAINHTGTVATYRGESNISGSINRFFRNGVQIGSNSNSQGTGNYANALLYFGISSASTIPLNGGIYGVITGGDLYTEQQIQNFEAFLSTPRSLITS